MQIHIDNKKIQLEKFSIGISSRFILPIIKAINILEKLYINCFSYDNEKLVLKQRYSNSL